MTSALTLRQPHASLVVVGAQTIVTQTRAAPKAMTGQRLLIHAAARKPSPYWRAGGYHIRTVGRVGFALEGPGLPEYRSSPRPQGHFPYFGRVVASCTLTDCVPIVDGMTWRDMKRPRVEVFEPTRGGSDRAAFLRSLGPDEKRVVDVTAQLPFGDFTPGRSAWLLGDVKPTSERCPRCWGTPDAALAVFADYRDAVPGPEHVPACPTCHDLGRCEPVPMKGRSGLWLPKPEGWQPEMSPAG